MTKDVDFAFRQIGKYARLRRIERLIEFWGKLLIISLFFAFVVLIMYVEVTGR